MPSLPTANTNIPTITVHLWNARVDPRRRTYAAGLYTHVLDRYGIVYDQPIVLNERQAGAAIAGVEHYNHDQHHRLSMLTVDTHGYTHAGMAGASFWGSTCTLACARWPSASCTLLRAGTASCAKLRKLIDDPTSQRVGFLTASEPPPWLKRSY